MNIYRFGLKTEEPNVDNSTHNQKIQATPPTVIATLVTTTKRHRLDGQIILRNYASTDFVSLPEQVIREIFSYLSDSDLFLHVRETCIRLRRQVDAYINIGKL